jgi:hypothetical protein
VALSRPARRAVMAYIDAKSPKFGAFNEAVALPASPGAAADAASLTPSSADSLELGVCGATVLLGGSNLSCAADELFIESAPSARSSKYAIDFSSARPISCCIDSRVATRPETNGDQRAIRDGVLLESAPILSRTHSGSRAPIFHRPHRIVKIRQSNDSFGSSLRVSDSSHATKAA